MRRNYDDPVYAEWRKRVLSRDKYKCQMPHCKAKRRLQVHHIRKWSSASMLRFEMDNGIDTGDILYQKEISLFGEEPIFKSNTPDTTMNFIAPRITEIYFAVLDDWVGPVCNV